MVSNAVYYMKGELMSNEAMKVQNNSGMGANSVAPEVVSKRFNWGACFLSWIWGLFHKSYLTLLTIPAVFIPFIGAFVCIGLDVWFGIKGNEWAWQNKKWESVEHFHSVQKKWAIAGIIVFVVGMLFQIISVGFMALIATSGMQQ